MYLTVNDGISLNWQPIEFVETHCNAESPDFGQALTQTLLL